MKFDYDLVHEFGGSFVALVIDTPSEKVHVREVERFCRVLGSSVDLLETTGLGRIALFRFNLHATKGSKPPTLFLDAVCALFRRRAFPIAHARATLCPLALQVRPPGGVATARSEGLVNEATYKICRAFLENETVQAARFVYMDLPAVPSQAMMNAFLAGGSLSVNLRVSATPGLLGPDCTVVQFQLKNGSCVSADGAPYVAAVTERVLDATSPVKDIVKVTVHSSTVVEVVAASMRKRRGHLCKCLLFVVGDRETLVHGGGGGGAFVAAAAAAVATAPGAVDRHPTLDGSDLCAAALCCPSVIQLAFQGFQFSPAAVAAAKKALKPSSSAGTRASLESITLLNCSFVRNESRNDEGAGGAALRICDLAIAMSRPAQLQHVQLVGTQLELSDMKTLCGMLTSSEGRLKCVEVGGVTRGGEPCVTGDAVLHFFRELPLMRTLKELMFEHAVPPHMARAVADGFKDNHFLIGLEGLTFEPDDAPASRLLLEVVLYLRANAEGRETVAMAAANPGSREHHKQALKVLRRLSKTDAALDETARYLCVRVFLPAYCARNVGRGP
jgi:hypothetical protein